MKKRLIVGVCLLPTVLLGGGFQVKTEGVKAMGFGGMYAALAPDASTVFYNPGGLTKLDNSITAGVSVVLPFTSYLDPYDGNSDREVSPSIPFHFYGSYKINQHLSAGLALNTPSCINTKWKNDWTGRYIIQSERRQTLAIQPTLAYAFNQHLSVGGGIVAAWMKTKEKKAIDVSSASTNFGEAESTNNGTSVGFNLGLLINYAHFSFGVNYRSQTSFKLKKGKVKFTDIPAGAILLEDFPEETDFSTTLILPAVWNAGLSYDVTGKLLLTTNFSFEMLSSVADSKFEYPQYPSLNYTEVNNFNDALSLGLGGQYHYNERTWLRIGLVYSNSAVEDGYVSPATPDAISWHYSGGISYLWKKSITLDAAIMLQDYKSRIERNNKPYNFNGEYKSTLYIIGIGANYVF